MTKRPVTPDQILVAFEEVEEDFPNKSDEWLYAMTAERLGIEMHQVVEGLANSSAAKPAGDRR